MSDVVDAVAKAMKARLIEKGVWMQREEHRGVVAIQVDGHVDFEDLARAAIEAYEAAKMRDLLSGLLVQKVSPDGRTEHIDREAMMNTWEGRKR